MKTAIALLAVGLFSVTAHAQSNGWTETSSNTTTSDKVGIGYSASSLPSFPLDLLANSNTPFRIAGSTNPGFVITTSGGSPLCSFGIATAAGNFIGGTAVNDVALRADSGGKILFSTSSVGSTNDLTIGSGKVGVGTAFPAFPLDLTANVNTPLRISGNSNPGFVVANAGTTMLSVGIPTSAGNFIANSAVNDVAIRADSGQKILFSTSASGQTNDLSLGGGNVGIGTLPDQTHKLLVNGAAQFNGTVTGTNIQANYQDVAEWVPASAAMRPGTVVVLNPNRANEVMPSAAAYDTAVAGVVSAQPGILLGEASASKAAIATTGRVLVRVDASQAPIRIGDLLVTSGKPGAAMRSQPIDINGQSIHRPGTIIGKALQPLASGEGEILVLLSMQ
jgi:hypothetical protein